MRGGSWGRAGSAALLALASAGCSSRLGAPSPATQEGESVISLWRLLFWSAAGVGALVIALILWCVVRYRARPGDEAPPQVSGSIPLELLYTGGALVLAAVLFAATLVTERSARGAADEGPAVPVDVTGFQWQWRFHYPDHGVTVLGTPTSTPELVLPSDRRVRLRLDSQDVIHSLYVPNFLTKRDLIPGSPEELDIRLVRTGRYTGNCAEFCGLYHARMGFSVRVVPAAEFDRWARAQGPPPPAVPPAEPMP